jgi:DNA adenine methylase
MESPLRWAGSKRQLIPKLLKFWKEPSSRYIEPFCGSARLFFAIEPARAILGDINSELIMTYRSLRADIELVLQCLRRLRKGESSYYKLRRIDPHGLSDAARAARFIYLNRFCFNGIYRTNKRGQFNVPFGPPKASWKFDEATLARAASALRGVHLVSQDFEITLDEAKEGDFAFIDPPYAVSQRRIFREYAENSFTIMDLNRLDECLHSLDRRGVRFVVSYCDSLEARNLLKRWPKHRVWTRRHIAGFANRRRGAYEILATNMP